jgi:putative ABC transport system permease protein
VAAGIVRLLPTAVVEDPDQEADEMLAAPVSGGLVIAFVLAVLLAGLLCAAAVVMTLMLAAPARARLLAVLQTLGLSPRQGRGLVGWEIGPWAVVALAVGAVLGVAVPSLVLAAVDVTALTGGITQPDAAYDPLLLGAAAAGFVVVVLAAVGVAAALSRRGEVAAQLRMGSND